MTFNEFDKFVNELRIFVNFVAYGDLSEADIRLLNVVSVKEDCEKLRAVIKYHDEKSGIDVETSLTSR